MRFKVDENVHPDVAALLREVCAMEREVEGEFRMILEDWDPQAA